MPLSLKDIRPDPGFREATIADAGLLFSWREQAERNHWFEGQPVTYDNHLRWLTERVSNPLVHLLIWDHDGDPHGMVRIDSAGEVAFFNPDDEDAVAMLKAAAVYVGEHSGRLKATVDRFDARSVRLLMEAGFRVYPATFLCLK